MYYYINVAKDLVVHVLDSKAEDAKTVCVEVFGAILDAIETIDSVIVRYVATVVNSATIVEQVVTKATMFALVDVRAIAVEFRSHFQVDS